MSTHQERRLAAPTQRADVPQLPHDLAVRLYVPLVQLRKHVKPLQAWSVHLTLGVAGPRALPLDLQRGSVPVERVLPPELGVPPRARDGLYHRAHNPKEEEVVRVRERGDNPSIVGSSTFPAGGGRPPSWAVARAWACRIRCPETRPWPASRSARADSTSLWVKGPNNEVQGRYMTQVCPTAVEWLLRAEPRAPSCCTHSRALCLNSVLSSQKNLTVDHDTLTRLKYRTGQDNPKMNGLL